MQDDPLEAAEWFMAIPCAMALALQVCALGQGLSWALPATISLLLGVATATVLVIEELRDSRSFRNDGSLAIPAAVACFGAAGFLFELALWLSDRSQPRMTSPRYGSAK